MGAEFQKTIIVDLDHAEVAGEYRQTIKRAVDDLGTDGGVVIVEEGDYTIDDTGYQTTVDVPDNCTIIGRGDVNVNVTADVPLFKNEDFGTNEKSRIVLSGFKIHVDMSSGTYQNHLIHFKGVKNCILEKLTISAISAEVNDSYAAIKLEGFQHAGTAEYYSCTGNVITECNIQDFGYGIIFKGVDSSHSNCTENMIQNNTISNNTTSNIELSYAPYNIISNNILADAGDHGLYVCNESNFASIVGNEVIGNSDEGIYVKESNSCALQSNVCNNNGDSGIRLEGSNGKETKYFSVSGNTCSSNGLHGINLETYVQHNVFSGNTCCSNTNTGIFSQDNSSYHVTTNIFLGNICHANTTQVYFPVDTNYKEANNITS